MDKYTVILSSYAQQDIASCVSFVLNVSKEAAIELKNKIFSSLKTLDAFPDRNPTFVMPKAFPYLIRKLIIDKRYIALYSVEDAKVLVYRIIDSRRQFDYLLF